MPVFRRRAARYLKCITEANISLPEMVDVGLEIRSACSLPLVLDGTCGWGDPMHLHADGCNGGSCWVRRY